MMLLNKNNFEIFTVIKIDFSKKENKNFVEIYNDRHGSFVGTIESLLNGDYKIKEKQCLKKAKK